MDYGHSIDDWAEDTEDDFCDACDDWTADDGHGNCKACGIKYNTVDPFLTPHVAKAYSSTAPTVSATGDLYGRSSGFTWGSGGSWWNRGVGAMTSMWGASSHFDRADKEKRLVKHKAHLDSLCKVVDPTVKHVLNYATEKSYSNINRGLIYVDGTLLDRDDSKLDIVAGLAIHEKLHLVYSKPLLKLERVYAYDHKLRPPQEKLIHNIANILEDEFIESQLGKTHGGFTHYIAKVKEHYFDKHGSKMEKVNEFGDVINTLLALVRYPSALDEERKKRHANHIQFFARALVNANNNRESMWEATVTIYEYMNQLAKDIAEKDAKDGPSPKEKAEAEMDRLMNDWDDKTKELLTESQLDDILDKLVQKATDDKKYEDRAGPMRTIMDGVESASTEMADYSADLDTISTDLEKAITELEDTMYSEEKWDTGRALGLKQGTKVTWRNQKSHTDAKYSYDNGVSRMKQSISQLKKRIQLYGNTQAYTIRNQPRGRLDKRMLHKIPLGRTDLFKNIIVDEDKPLDVCLLVDESGSMGSYKMQKARESAIAIREALKDNDKLNLWVYGHTADGYDWDGTGETNMSCYWSPTYKSDLKAMGAMRARSENRDGMAILASADRVKAESPSMGSNRLMIVISDGEPSAKNYRHFDGIAHTKKCVRHIEGQGWSVIQIGISGAREYIMKDMFTNYIMCDDTAELPTKVSKVIRKVIKV